MTAPADAPRATVVRVLVAAVAVVCIALVTVTSLSTHRERELVAAAEKDVRAAAFALEAHKVDAGVYPGDLTTVPGRTTEICADGTSGPVDACDVPSGWIGTSRGVVLHVDTIGPTYVITACHVEAADGCDDPGDLAPSDALVVWDSTVDFLR